ncbi:hypothetical protein [Bradyrhizobium sp. CCGUVB23]|uniref:hypothetical protein n=1 Tax=Bradyrhizobium sp. CCGUVB23 TaxID=2949630 RepID=UPI0020B2DF34|nr:hypothetical protein [Bradyrhizobium sp. CCGUVB23]MCP3463569.1 hypothetical protein [Bradyrhizobium sp. CCGUVB23]
MSTFILPVRAGLGGSSLHAVFGTAPRRTRDTVESSRVSGRTSAITFKLIDGPG